MYIVSIVLLVFLIAASAYLLTLIYSIFFRSPYVATSDNIAKEILSHAHLSKVPKNASFIDLGAGDGRVVKIAQRQFSLKATGYEVNPMLRLYAKLRYGINLSGTNLFDAPIAKADIIYIYLFPALIKKLEPKLLSECKKGTIIISFTFPIKGFFPKLTHERTVGNRPAFYYKM